MVIRWSRSPFSIFSRSPKAATPVSARWGPIRPFEFQHSFGLVLSDLQRL
jgi:hypothetical protein